MSDEEVEIISNFLEFYLCNVFFLLILVSANEIPESLDQNQVQPEAPGESLNGEAENVVLVVETQWQNGCPEKHKFIIVKEGILVCLVNYFGCPKRCVRIN